MKLKKLELLSVTLTLVALSFPVFASESLSVEESTLTEESSQALENALSEKNTINKGQLCKTGGCLVSVFENGEQTFYTGTCVYVPFHCECAYIHGSKFSEGCFAH